MPYSPCGSVAFLKKDLYNNTMGHLGNTEEMQSEEEEKERKQFAKMTRTPVAKLVVMLGICIGVYLCHQTAKDMGVHDHGSIVWDEFIGMWITLMALPTNDWQWVAAGFVIFRILDMWKPWPIRWFDRNVHGGMGIMIDDIVAGVISAGILYFIGHHWPLGILS